MEASLASLGSKNLLMSNGTNGTVSARPNLANLSNSFSTNDLPTLKSNPTVSAMASQPTHAEKHFHNHNASMGRFPANGVNNRISRDLGSNNATNAIPESRRDEQVNGLKALQSDLHANATPFGPTTSAGSPAEPVSGVMTPPSMQGFANPAYYGGYGMNMMNMNMAQMQLGGMGPFANQMSMYQGQNPYGAFSAYNQAGRFQDSQARVMQQRRAQTNDGELGLMPKKDEAANHSAQTMRALTTPRSRTTRERSTVFARINMVAAISRSSLKRARKRR